MRIAVSQFAPVQDVEANLQSLVKHAEAAAADGARIVVFPEAAMHQCMSTAAQIREAAEPLDGPFVSRLAETASSLGVAVVAGMYESRADGQPFNTVVVVGPDGVQATHRKYLLYDAFGFRESDLVTRADPATDVFEVDGVTIGLITCYEVRFPETARALVDAGAQLLVVCSAWPLAPGKEEHFVTMVRARALENTVYVAAAGDCSPTMVGRSHVVDPLGYQTAGLGNEPGHVCAEIDLDRVARARQTLPLLAQRAELLPH